MKIYLECLPCFLKQVLEASRLATERTDLHEIIMKETIGIIGDYERFRYSPEVGKVMHQIVKKHTGNKDPYEQIKKENIENALELYPSLKHFLYKKEERLYWALKIAATGNTIDSAIYHNINIKKNVENEIEEKFSICDIDKLKSILKHAKNLLIIGDNAGETVFDKILVENLLHLDITYAVRNNPIINDATYEDAIASGLGNCTKIVKTGCDAPGLILDECNDEFIKIFKNADIVISKGQGNYEALSDTDRDLFFLLKAKCNVIANKLNVNINDYIFKWN